jgi:L-arabinose isomerase
MGISKPKIGLLTVFFDLYLVIEDDLLGSCTKFAADLVEQIGTFAEVTFPGVVKNRVETQQAVKEFEKEEVDLMVVVFLTYAPSMYVLPALLETKIPILLFCTQSLFAITETLSGRDTDENHGIHGFQDMANTLRRNKKPYHFVTGYWQNPQTLTEIQAWARAAQVQKILKKSSIGLIGYPMENMGDFGVDETAFQSQIGLHIHHIPMQAIAVSAGNAPAGEIEASMARDRQQFQAADGITQAEHESAVRIEWAIRKMMQKQELIGFSYHFLAVAQEGQIQTMPFLAASKLLSEGYSFGGEGDVTSAAAVSILQLLAGEANFTEMFSMNFAGGTVLMSHMGEGNWKMAHPDYPPRLFACPFDLVLMKVNPVSLVFTLRPGHATLFNVTFGPDGKMSWIVSEGEILDNPPLPKLNVVNFQFKPHLALEDFLTQYGTLGGSHHQAIAYGSFTQELLKLASLFNIACQVI